MPEQEANPYVGPRPFERSDKQLFFGRDAESQELLSLVIAERVVLLYAASGAGKSSLLQAGLIPLLADDGFELFPVARIHAAVAEETLAKAQDVYVLAALSSWEGASADADLTHVTLAQYLARRPHPRDRSGFEAPRTLVFDQFEELFTQFPTYWHQRQDFFEQLARALAEDPLLRVVLAIREDYLAQLDPYADLLPGGLRTRLRIERLGSEQALTAVASPLRNTRRSFAPGVAEKLVADLLRFRVDTGRGTTTEVEGEFVEPVQLQVACQSLWAELPADVDVITEDHLRTFGDVDEVLRRFYDDAVGAAAVSGGVRERHLRDWVEMSFITSVGTRSTVYRSAESTGEIPNTAIDELEGRHLVRAEWRSGARWYELTHDRFIEPIQSSNARFRSRRARKRRTRASIAVGALVLALAAVAASQTLNSSSDSAPAPTAALATPATLSLTAPLRLNYRQGKRLGARVSLRVTTHGLRGKLLVLASSTIDLNAPILVGSQTTSTTLETLVPTAASDAASIDVWIHQPRKPGRFHYEISVSDPDGTLLDRVSTPTFGCTTSTCAVLVSRSVLLGKSVQGRAITALETGNPDAKRKLLVIGCTHGDECSGIAIAKTLAHVSVPADVDLWIVPNLNPDGYASRPRRRTNAHGVDINRNFGVGWTPAADHGRRPFSEPESRIARDLITRLRPAVTIWYFERVERPPLPPGVAESGGTVAIERRYARTVGLRLMRNTDGSALEPPGSGPLWQNKTFRNATAFFVELPFGKTLGSAVAERHSAGVLGLARGS